MTSTELKNHEVTRKLIQIQESIGLRDNQFADTIRLGLHGANWGKIKAGTYTGSHSKALLKMEVALDAYHNPGTGESEEGIVILSHVREALDAMEIAKAADDEHRLVIVAGHRGSGKTRTLTLCNHRFPGHYIEAMPSWGGSYFDFLVQFSAGLGMSIQGKRSKGAYESAILSEAVANPQPIFIDEFNYFSPHGINFLKTMLNRIPAPIMTATVPKFLAGMAADSRTAQESAQFIRRAVAILHIPTVTEREVLQVQTALMPHLALSTELARSIAESSNRHDRLDSVYAILEDAKSLADVPKAIGRHERSKKTILTTPIDQ